MSVGELTVAVECLLVSCVCRMGERVRVGLHGGLVDSLISCVVMIRSGVLPCLKERKAWPVCSHYHCTTPRDTQDRGRDVP